jgi:hypothetical protein
MNNEHNTTHKGNPTIHPWTHLLALLPSSISPEQFQPLETSAKRNKLKIKMSSQSEEFNDEGAGRPIPSFDASSIKLTTIAPALGVADDTTPDYLQIEGTSKGRGLVTTMFANTGLSYLIGIFGGGIYGLNEGLKNTPSNRFKVKVNSVLNHCSRHGSRIGNVAGVLSIFYSVYEHTADTVSTVLHGFFIHLALLGYMSFDGT